MKYLLLLALLIVSHFAVAEDGLVVELSIDEQISNSQDIATSTSMIPMGFNESISLSVEGDYGVTIVSKKGGAKQVNLIVTLIDQSNDASDFLGDRSIDIDVGESVSYQITQKARLYTVTVATSYGEIANKPEVE